MARSLPHHLTRRRSLALGLALFAGPAGATQRPCAEPRVLFVCPAGTVKSAIARETLKARATAAGVPVRVRSRGLRIENHVSPDLAAHLRADGIDPAAEAARQLQDADITDADIVIAFDEAAQAPALRDARVWDIPSWNTDYSGAKAALAVRMDALVAELRARQERPCTDGRR
jgi:fructose-specific phosphotransferase system component IIB